MRTIQGMRRQSEPSFQNVFSRLYRLEYGIMTIVIVVFLAWRYFYALGSINIPAIVLWAIQTMTTFVSTYGNYENHGTRKASELLFRKPETDEVLLFFTWTSLPWLLLPTSFLAPQPLFSFL